MSNYLLSPTYLESARRKTVLTNFGYNSEDVLIWSNKFQNIKLRAVYRNTEFNLTFDDYVELAKETGISNPNEIGTSLHQYAMARVGDTGPYKRGNCRFITVANNLEERTINGGSARAGEINRTKRSKSFILESPGGDIFQGTNLKLFCDEHDMNQGAMAKVCRERKGQHKGWTGCYKDNNNDCD